ncbi:hypothetical protein FRC02_009623 [Tulasnella sp. 418]|nr:hypothetical protein FRC02_009623 [Tulasnella sp. 418]
MAAFYASSPPPQKAPSIAPTQNSELTSPSEDNSASKKKSSFMKRALKELAGGGGNNPKVKGQPVVRPYGRGGVGAKAKPSASSAKTSSSQSPPQSVSSPSNPPRSPTTDSSLAQQQQQRHLQVPHPQSLPPSRDDTPSQSQYEYSDYDDTQSLASSIPAPRRTQQWIQQQAPLNSAPMSPTSSNDPYGAQSYAYGQHPSRLHDVEEDDDPATHMDDQFGRLSVANSSVIRDHQSVPGRSDPRSRLVLHPSSSVSVGSRPPVTAAREIAASYYGASSSTSASRPPVDPFAANSYNSFLPPHHHLPPSQPQSVVDHYSAAHAQNQAVHARSHLISAQTQELQAQIENLREAERRARERLEALRRDDNLPLRKNTSPEDESPLDGRPPPPPRSATSPVPPSRREGNISRPGMDGSEILEGPSSSMTPARPLAPPNALGYGPMSREERAREEKERLRQRDREREEANAAYHQQHDPYATPANLYAQQYQRGAPSYHQPPASTFSQSAYPSHMQSHIPHNPPPSMASTSAPVQHFHHHQPHPSQPQPQPQQPQAFADPAQQQLILQLGALLIQQQQQLAALNASRPGGSSGASPPAPGLPLPSPGGGGLDLSALLTLAAAAGNLNPAAAAALAAAQNANRPAQTQQAPSAGPSSSPTTRTNQTSPPQIPVPPIPITTTTSTTVSVPTSQGDRPTPPSQSTTPIIKRKVSSGTPITNTYNRDAGNPPQLPQPEFGREFSLTSSGARNANQNLDVPSNPHNVGGGGSPASAVSSLNTTGSTNSNSNSPLTNTNLSNSAAAIPRRPNVSPSMLPTSPTGTNSTISNPSASGLGVAHLSRELENMGLRNEDLDVGTGSEVGAISPPPPYVRATGGI